MKDREISRDVDSPATTAPDWDGVVLRQGGVELGKARTRGPNRSPTTEQVAIRYNPEVIAAFRASGSGWQTRMNNALEDWLKSHSPANV